MSDERALIERLSMELDRLRAREEIRHTIHAYARALDRLDRELLLRQFWPDAEVDFGSIYRGRADGFCDVALRFQGSMRDTQHFVGNILIQLEGNQAFAESYVHATHVIVEGNDLVQLFVGARYLDRLERRAAEWRLSYRTEVIDWARRTPIPERWFENNTELPKGLRSRADPSYQFSGP